MGTELERREEMRTDQWSQPDTSQPNQEKEEEAKLYKRNRSGEMTPGEEAVRYHWKFNF